MRAIFPALLLLATSPLAVAADEDVIVFENGDSVVCRIEALTDNIATFRLPPVPGVAGGSARRTVSTDQVSHVLFGFVEGEERAFEKRGELGSETLATWWDYHFAHLHRPRSRTAAWGVALGEALLREDPEENGREALALFDRIIERAWSEDDVALAEQGRLRALIALGDLETAMGEARLLAQQTEDPELLIEVKFLLAEADFAALRELEEENPRWEEDDEVRPDRNRLYHRVLDQFLWPHLFHATRTDAAARGLLSVGAVYEFAEETGRARGAYEDLARLYPDTELVAEARTRLESLSGNETTSPSENP